jgi:putative peptidoglycan lipid II flippase
MTQLKSSTDNTAASENVRVTKAAGVVGLATLLSRILGYVRDVVMASFFGAGLFSDAFIAAFRIPNLLRRLFGEGSLTVAFVPVFAECLSRDGRVEAEKLAGSALRLLALVLVAVSVLGLFLAPGIVHLMAYGFTDNPEQYALCVQLTRVMFPYIIFIGLVALCMGILNTLGHFAAPALSPTLLNVGMIGAVLVAAWMSPSKNIQVIGLAVGVLVGGVLQLGLQVPFLIKEGIHFWRSTQLWHPAIKKVLVLMGPAVFGAAVYQINSLVGTLMASLLPMGSVSYLYYADRLAQFPLGIFGIALATAVLPTLSRQAAAGQFDDLRATFAHAIKLIFFITLPCMAGLIVLREPIVALLFQRGHFDAATTQLTASALLYYSLGLWAFAAVRIVLNTFYALQDTRTPVRMAVISIVANVALGAVLMWPMKHNGLALALSLASALNLGMLTVALRKRLGAIGWRLIAASVSKSGLCAALMGLAVWLLAQWVIPAAGGHWLGALAGLIICLITGIVVFIGSAYLVKVPELKTVLKMLRKRTPKR